MRPAAKASPVPMRSTTERISWTGPGEEPLSAPQDGRPAVPVGAQALAQRDGDPLEIGKADMTSAVSRS